MTTDLKDVPDERLNVMLAEALGWNRTRYPKTYRQGGKTFEHQSYGLNERPELGMHPPGVPVGPGSRTQAPPNYTGCLNACASVEATLDEVQHKLFRVRLWAGVTGLHCGIFDYDNSSSADRRKFVSASARQRAEALYLTLKK